MNIVQKYVKLYESNKSNQVCQKKILFTLPSDITKREVSSDMSIKRHEADLSLNPKIFDIFGTFVSEQVCSEHYVCNRFAVFLHNYSHAHSYCCIHVNCEPTCLQQIQLPPRNFSRFSSNFHRNC